MTRYAVEIDGQDRLGILINVGSDRGRRKDRASWINIRSLDSDAAPQ